MAAQDAWARLAAGLDQGSAWARPPALAVRAVFTTTGTPGELRKSRRVRTKINSAASMPGTLKPKSATSGGKGHFRFESRTMVPAAPSGYRRLLYSAKQPICRQKSHLAMLFRFPEPPLLHLALKSAVCGDGKSAPKQPFVMKRREPVLGAIRSFAPVRVTCCCAVDRQYCWRFADLVHRDVHAVLVFDS